jgi:Domain of unknown function (DUF4397)
MKREKNNMVTGFIILCVLSVFLTPYISSCGKSGQATSAGLNVQLEVLNLSPNVHPVNLYMNYIKQSSFPYSYPSSSGYFFLNDIDTPLQIRSASASTTNLISISQPGFGSNHKYTLFITGQYSTDSISGQNINTLTAVLTKDDTAATPNVGFGKIRFVNLAIPNTLFNITANGTATKVFNTTKLDSISKYIQMPAGNYIFQISPASAPGSILTTTLGTTTIQDGRLYTLYCYGIVGRTDTSAFNAGVLINR